MDTINTIINIFLNILAFVGCTIFVLIFYSTLTATKEDMDNAKMKTGWTGGEDCQELSPFDQAIGMKKP